MNNNPTDIYGNLTWLNKQVQKLYCLIESLGGGGSITINPTNGYVPVRTSATTFGDSAIESSVSFTRIEHEFGDYIMRLFVSAEDNFKIESFSYFYPQNAEISLVHDNINLGVGGDGVNGNITINENSVAISAFESGHYSSRINADPSSLYLNAQYINADNPDIQYWARQTISNTQIVTNVYTGNGGNFETSYTETIVPGYLDVLLIQQDLDTQLRTTYVANSSNPSINTYVSYQGDGGSSLVLYKDKIQLSAGNINSDSGCTFKIYVSGIKTRYNFSNVYTFNSNAAALAGGLVVNDIYRNNSGTLSIVF